MPADMKRDVAISSTNLNYFRIWVVGSLTTFGHYALWEKGLTPAAKDWHNWFISLFRSVDHATPELQLLEQC